MRFILKQLRKLSFRGKPLAFVFSEFYRKNLWGADSKSGAGSDLIQTSTIRRELPLLFKWINAKSLLDAACGDFHWMRDIELGLIQYTGIDVVPDLVAQNQHNYSNEIRKFINLDITEDDLPCADVILCRDCLVHFSLRHIISTIRNFKRTGSQYLLTTTFTSLLKNKDVTTGGWRPLNLQLSPFNFPEPVELIYEGCTESGAKYSDKSLGLWKFEDIRI